MTDPEARGGDRITVERFRDGWVIVDRAGVISTPCPMSEPTARAYARLLGIDRPEDDV